LAQVVFLPRDTTAQCSITAGAGTVVVKAKVMLAYCDILWVFCFFRSISSQSPRSME